MASPTASPRLLSLLFMLIVLMSMHHCSARKALLEDLHKQEKAQQPKGDTKTAPMPESGGHGVLAAQKNDTSSKQSEIGCGGQGCESQCFEEPCNGGRVVIPGHDVVVPGGSPYLIPTPPIVFPQPPRLVNPPPIVIQTPPYVVPTPTPCTTPCESWYGPGPCPCPCEEGDEKEGVKTEGKGDDIDKSNKKAQEGEKPLVPFGKEKMQDGAPSTSTADAPMPARVDGSNIHD